MTCAGCGAKLVPQSFRLHQGRTLCPTCLARSARRPRPERAATLEPFDLLQLLVAPRKYLAACHFQSPPWPTAFFLLLGSSLYLLTYFFLGCLDRPETALGQACSYFFSPTLQLKIAGAVLTSCACTVGGVLLTHLLAVLLGGQGRAAECFNLGGRIYGLVYLLQCALLVFLMAWGFLLAGHYITLEKMLRLPCHLFAAVLLLFGLRQVHGLTTARAAAAAAPGAALILALSYFF